MIRHNNSLRKLIFASLFMIAGTAAWIVLSAGQAGAFVISDQEATTVNVGVGVANTGGNVAVGNASDNDAEAEQLAVSGGGGDAIAVNNANASNNSNGTATIVTGNANANGNNAVNNTVQVADVDVASGAPVLVDQDATTVNVGVAVANTGLNLGVGNASENEAEAEQGAFAFGFFGDKLAVNDTTASNTSNGSATIVTGNANAVGNTAVNNTTQTVDVDGSPGFVLADQDAPTINFGLGVANSGLNFGFGNVSDNDTDVDQLAIAFGFFGDQVAYNNGAATNNSNGNVIIGTGNANAVGNSVVNHTNQTLDVVFARGASGLAPFALLMLLGLLFIATPARRLGVRRR